MSIFKRGPSKLDRVLAEHERSEAARRAQDPLRIYAAEGTPTVAHYARPDADVPMCLLGKWKVAWKVPSTEGERQWALVLRLCEDCRHIYEGQTGSEEGRSS